MLRQYRIGEVDQVLAGAVEGQRHEAPLLRQRHRAPADLVHADEIVLPALQRANGAIEELRRDLVRAQRLKSSAPPRAHTFKAQDGTGAAAAQRGPAGKPGQFEAQPFQPTVVGCQDFTPRALEAPVPAPIVLTLC